MAIRFRKPLATHPRRPRGSRSGLEKGRDESFQVRAKKPLGTDSHRTISKTSNGCRLLIGHKKCFVLLLVFSVTPFKIDQNKNQNRSIDNVQNLGNERRYAYKDPRQDSGQRNISYARYPKKCFTQTYRDLYGDAMLVPTWMSSNMADGNQQLPSFATKA